MAPKEFIFAQEKIVSSARYRVSADCMSFI
jgi:hypothetical protein